MHGEVVAGLDKDIFPASGTVSPLHKVIVVHAQAVPGRRMLISADESGLVSAVDLRMLGGEKLRRAVLWQGRNPTGGVTCMATAPHPSSGKPVSPLSMSSGSLPCLELGRQA